MSPATDCPPAEHSVPKLLTIPHVAEMTSWSRSFIYQEMTAGRLRSVRVGRTRRVLESSLIKLIEENTIGE